MHIIKILVILSSENYRKGLKNHGVQVLPFISFFTLYSLED